MAVATANKKGITKSLIQPGYFSGIPGDDTYDFLGNAEMEGYTGLGESQAADIGQFATDYEGTHAKRRADLAKSLSDYSSGMFEQMNPGILEDLNRRGLFNSPTAVAREQASALKGLNLDAQNRLMDFDVAGYGKMDEYGEQGLGARLGGQTQGMESAFEMGRSKLERTQGEQDAERDASLAKTLAQIEADAQKKAAKTQMWGNIIGGGLSGLGSALCFDPETLIDMADGSKKVMKDIVLGDETKGGKVYSVRHAVAGDRFNYMGVGVTGTHAVLEDGEWIRVGTSKNAKPVSGEGLICSIVTTGHRIYSNGVTFADEWETDKVPKWNDEATLAVLNMEERENGNPS